MLIDGGDSWETARTPPAMTRSIPLKFRDQKRYYTTGCATPRRQ